MGSIEFKREVRRKKRISSNIMGTKDKPRISIYRSNKYIYAQAIDDQARSTIVSVSSLALKKDKTDQKGKLSGEQSTSGRKTEESKYVGSLLAKALKEKKIETGVFDRAMYSYKGRVKAFAEGLREGGFKI
jgi:large subunit ribosomal protein L18